MGDLTKGFTFGSSPPSNQGTPANFNALVDNATVNPALITGKASTAPAVGDSLLVSDLSASGALVKSTITQVLALQAADAAAGTPSLRTLGTAANQAAQGNLVPLLAASQTFTGTTNKFNHIGGATGVTIMANAGLGTGSPSAGLGTGSTDIFGTIQLVPGTSPTINSSQCTITFGVSYASAPFVRIGSQNAAAFNNQASTKALIVANVTAAGFDLLSNGVALTAGTYIFWYEANAA